MSVFYSLNSFYIHLFSTLPPSLETTVGDQQKMQKIKGSQARAATTKKKIFFFACQPNKANKKKK